MAGGCWDAVIVGGGPAGAAAAIRAAGCGLRCLVLEAERFPRHHVGESLVSLWPVFDALGVAAEVDAAFQHKRGSCRVWGRDAVLKWTDFQTYAGRRNYSLQIERARFDELMVARARAAGAEVREGHRVTGVLWEGERAVGVRCLGPDGREASTRARWVVDASGRRGLIARERALRRIDPFYPDLSVYAYYGGARRFSGEHCGNLLIEAVPWGWFWFIPLHTGEVSVGLVCDRTSRPELKRLGLLEYLGRALAQTSVVGDMLSAARIARGPYATASYGYFAARYAGPGWILAGDAGAFVDPMWATGVANALLDGILAAAMVEASLGNAVPEAGLVEFYQRESERRARFTLALVKHVYRFNRLHERHPFWAGRRDAGADGLTVGQIMHRLARDPSIRYFRDAFLGMGLTAAQLEPLDRTIEGFERRDAQVAPLVEDPERWIPRLRARVRLYRSVGYDPPVGLKEGLVADDGDLSDFVWDPGAMAALQAIDGRRTARDVIDAVAATAPPGRRLSARFQLLATLVDACERGIIEARPAEAGPGRGGPERSRSGDPGAEQGREPLG